MKKLEEINRLVEEALNELHHRGDKGISEILTTLARKCAEINEDDIKDAKKSSLLFPSKTIYEIYNSRIRDGQVGEVEQEEKPTLQPLPEEVPVWFIPSWTQSVGGLHMRIEEWKKVIQHFGIKPPEWWRDLKKGDKFMCYKESWVFDEIMLKAGDGRVFYLSKCSPYTDPTQSFRSKLTPEMQVEFDKLMKK